MLWGVGLGQDKNLDGKRDEVGRVLRKRDKQNENTDEVAHASYRSTQETEAGGQPLIQGQPDLYSKFQVILGNRDKTKQNTE